MSHHIGVRVTNQPEHGLSVHRDGDRFLWVCRCGFELVHPVDTPITPAELTAHFRWTIR